MEAVPVLPHLYRRPPLPASPLLPALHAVPSPLFSSGLALRTAPGPLPLLFPPLSLGLNTWLVLSF